MRRIPLASLVLLLAAASATSEEETRLLGFPREGVSVRAPASWSLDQFVERVAPLTEGAAVPRVPIPVARLTKGAAVIEIFIGKTAIIPGGVAWTPPGAERGSSWMIEADGTSTATGFVERKVGPTVLVIATHPSAEATLAAEAKAIVDSLDVRPFASPRLFVDHGRKWAIEVPDGWEFRPANRAARFVSPDGGTVLGIDAWDDLPLARNHRGIQGLDEWIDVAVRSVLEESLRGERIVENDPPEVAEFGVDAGVEGRLAGFRVRTAAQKAEVEKGGKASGFATLVVTDRVRLMLLSDREGSPESKAGFDVLRTFSLDTTGPSRREEPAKAEEPPPDRFPSRAGPDGKPAPEGPPVAFRLPKGWVAEPPKSTMRLGQWKIPGPPPAEVVVYGFGKGGGGGVQANLDRWKGQIAGTDAPKVETAELAPGMKMTLLDASGRYVAETMPGSGERHDDPDSRMIAAVLEFEGGPLYVKSIGPRATMDAAAGELIAWIRSFRVR